MVVAEGGVPEGGILGLDSLRRTGRQKEGPKKIGMRKKKRVIGKSDDGENFGVYLTYSAVR